MITTAAPVPITREQIAALRAAGSIGFRTHWTPRDPSGLPGTLTATIEGILTRDRPGTRPFVVPPGYTSDGIPDWYRTPRYPVYARIHDYSDGMHGGASRVPLTCWASLTTYEHCPRPGWLHFLRHLDCVALQWARDSHSNQATRATGARGERLHGDSLSVVISRRGHEYEFPLAVSICPDNSARMIRGGHH